MAARRDEQPLFDSDDDELDGSVDAVSADGSLAAPQMAKDLLARQRRADEDSAVDGGLDFEAGAGDDSSIDEGSLHDGQLAHVTGGERASTPSPTGRHAALAGAAFGLVIVAVLAWLSGVF